MDKCDVLLIVFLLSGCAVRTHLYRVCWQGPYTHDKYCGQTVPRQVAQEAARAGNADLPHVKHWVERVK